MRNVTVNKKTTYVRTWMMQISTPLLEHSVLMIRCSCSKESCCTLAHRVRSSQAILEHTSGNCDLLLKVWKQSSHCPFFPCRDWILQPWIKLKDQTQAARCYQLTVCLWWTDHMVQCKVWIVFRWRQTRVFVGTWTAAAAATLSLLLCLQDGWDTTTSCQSIKHVWAWNNWCVEYMST